MNLALPCQLVFVLILLRQRVFHLLKAIVMHLGGVDVTPNDGGVPGFGQRQRHLYGLIRVFRVIYRHINLLEHCLSLRPLAPPAPGHRRPRLALPPYFNTPPFSLPSSKVLTYSKSEKAARSDICAGVSFFPSFANSSWTSLIFFFIGSEVIPFII